MSQPIIRGIQTVGHVDITYRYNLKSGTNYYLPIPNGFTFQVGETNYGSKNSIDLGAGGCLVAGFRLDSEFLRANPQIASSFVIPLLGGGGVALTNNNRTGTLTMVCTKVAVPSLKDSSSVVRMKSSDDASIGVASTTAYYDMVTLAQLQQAQEGGDPYGANITLAFEFSGVKTEIEFQACTVATVDPLGLAGNDAVNYNVVFNYLNWTCKYSSINTEADKGTPIDTTAKDSTTEG